MIEPAVITHQETARSILTLREARGRLCRYFQSIGYRVVGGDTAVLFERKRALGFVPGCPPRMWPARVYAALEEGLTGCTVSLRWEVSTKGRIVALWDLEYFKREVRSAANSLLGTDPELKKLEKGHLSAGLKSLAIYMAGLLTLVVTGVLVAIGEIAPTIWFLALFIVGTLLIAMRAPVPAAPKA